MSYSCVKVVIALKLITLLTVFVAKVDGHVTSEVNQTSRVEDYSNCWSSANLTCIKAVIVDNFKDIWQKKEKEIRITDSVVIEKISDSSPEDSETTEVKSIEEGRGHTGDAEKMLQLVGRFLKRHALRVDLWQFGTLRIERSEENPGNLEIIFYMNGGTPNKNGDGK